MTTTVINDFVFTYTVTDATAIFHGPGMTNGEITVSKIDRQTNALSYGKSSILSQELQQAHDQFIEYLKRQIVMNMT